MGSEKNRYKGCKAILNVYSQQTARETSAATVRLCVAQHSGKKYLNNGSQQDASEFLRSLLAMLSYELATTEAFSSVEREHWGREKIMKFFFG